MSWYLWCSLDGILSQTDYLSAVDSHVLVLVSNTHHWVYERSLTQYFRFSHKPLCKCQIYKNPCVAQGINGHPLVQFYRTKPPNDMPQCPIDCTPVHKARPIKTLGEFGGQLSLCLLWHTLVETFITSGFHIKWEQLYDMFAQAFFAKLLKIVFPSQS